MAEELIMEIIVDNSAKHLSLVGEPWPFEGWKDWYKRTHPRQWSAMSHWNPDTKTYEPKQLRLTCLYGNYIRRYRSKQAKAVKYFMSWCRYEDKKKAKAKN